MSYKLTLDPKPAYLHAIVTGVNSKVVVTRYLEDIRRECAARGCFRVLIEEHLEGPRLQTMDVFQIAADGSRSALGVFHAMAYVDVNADGGLMKFAETVAVNRGIPVRLFSSVADAEKWLLDRESGGTEPNASADADKPHG
jgi:hypothetical protein